MIKTIHDLLNGKMINTPANNFILEGNLSEIKAKINKINRIGLVNNHINGVSFTYLGNREGHFSEDNPPPYNWAENMIGGIYTCVFNGCDLIITNEDGWYIIDYSVNNYYDFTITKEGECAYIINVFGIKNLAEKLSNSFITLNKIKHDNKFLWAELENYFKDNKIETAYELGSIGF